MSSVTLIRGNLKKKLSFNENDTLLQTFQTNGVLISAPCGGNGKCGKCKVLIVEDNAEREVLSCKTKAVDNMTVRIEEDSPMDICDEFSLSVDAYNTNGKGYGVAVDLGTTTVAAELINLKDGASLGKISEMNEQKPYGADVISRTQYTMDNEEGLTQLSTIINNQINRMVNVLSADAKCNDGNVKLFIAGNTIMQHIMAGISPKSIALAPFTPKTLFPYDDICNVNCTFSPCISGYVGGDITAGILSTQLHKTNKNCLLVDLGTNGEMALSRTGDIVCCSVASGPAFEGAGISCGMASVPGAISHFEWANNKLSYTTIEGAAAIGICGSGIIELVAILVKLGIIDGSGYLQPPDDLDDTYGIMVEEDEDGNGIVYITQDRTIYFNAKDVRQIQLAKSAVASGIQILLEEAGLDSDQIDVLYLAGGFGTYIDVESAALIGMFKPEMKPKATSVGNSSLAGAVLALSSDEARRDLYAIPKQCRYIELSGDKRFNDYFADNMAFYED